MANSKHFDGTIFKKEKKKLFSKNCYHLILYFQIAQNMKHQSLQHFNRSKANRTK